MSGVFFCADSTYFMRILFTGGIGDVFSLESMMTEEERSSIKEIYWATRSAKPAKTVFQASQRYRHVRHIVLPIPQDQTYFKLDGVLEDFPGLPSDVVDWSIMVRFDEFNHRPYTPSTFLVEDLAAVDHFELPDRYVLIQHQTPINSPVQRQLRDLDTDEWQRILARLDDEDLYAVVVNSADADDPPQHPRVVNLVGNTSYPESIEILKRAQGYWGISSSLCVLAAQWFDASDLWVKNPEPWGILHKHIYFAPQTQYRFLFRHLCKETPITAIHRGMQTIAIEMKIVRMVAGQLVGPGSVVELPADIARGFIATGQADLYVPKPTLQKAISMKGKSRKTATRIEE